MSNTIARISTVNAEMFKDSVFFSLSLHRWGNRARVRNPAALQEYLQLLTAPEQPGLEQESKPTTMIERGSGTNSTATAKRCLVSKPLDELNEFLNDTKAKLCGQFGLANPSRIKEGLFVVGKPLVQKFEDILEDAQKQIAEVYLPAFLADYPAAIERAEQMPVKKGGLGPIFDSRDYPSAENTAKLFRIDWQWMALGVPEDLPAQLRAKAAEKLEKQFAEAADEVKIALREGFANLIEHATERLTPPGPGEKPKVFRDTLIGNISQFIEVFSARNIMNDTELGELVEKAKAVTSGLTPKKLRDLASVRDTTRQQFAEIKATLDQMMITKANRKIELAPEPEEPAAVAA